jgi:hypothetical protein
MYDKLKVFVILSILSLGPGYGCHYIINKYFNTMHNSSNHPIIYYYRHSANNKVINNDNKRKI